MKASELLERLNLQGKAISVRRTKSVIPSIDLSKGCSLRDLNRVLKGETLVLTKDNMSCRGAKHGFGFDDSLPTIPGGFGKFITKGAGKGAPAGERIKCCEEVAENMMRMQPKNVMEGFDSVTVAPLSDESLSELVMLLATPDQLAALQHLFTYRDAAYDRVIMPMSSGCASMFRIPFGEMMKTRRAVIGNADIFSRPHFDKDTFFFVVDQQSWLEMLEDADESFLNAPIWKGIQKRI